MKLRDRSKLVTKSYDGGFVPSSVVGFDKERISRCQMLSREMVNV
jgi:hypothetical protein